MNRRSLRWRSFAPVALAAVVLLAAALRLHNLGTQSLWYDEGNSYVQATRTLPDIAANAARDIHPPGYYVLLAGWRLIAGESEFALRSLSAFASVVTVALALAVGRRWFGMLGGALVALLVALNTFSIYYAQEVRMYALLGMWATASLWLVLRLLNRPTRVGMAALALVNAAGLWTHYAFPFFMLAQAVIVAAAWITRGTNRRAAAAFTLANIGALALFAPWLPTALTQLTTWQQVRDAAPLTDAISTLLAWLLFGVTAERVAPALALVLLLFGLRLRRDETLTNLIAPLAWALVPAVTFLALGLFREANLKFLLPAQVGVALWLARGIVAVWRVHEHLPRLNAVIPRAAALGAAAWLLVTLWSVVPPLYDDPAFQRPDYRAVAAYIAAEGREGDAIILNAPNQDEVFRYYYDGDLPIYPLPAGLGGDDDATRAEVERIIAAHYRAFVAFYGETERDPNRIVEIALDAGAFELSDQWYGDVRLARYAMPQPLDFVVEPDASFMGTTIITLDSYALSGREPDRDFAIRAAPGDVIQARLAWRADEPITARYKVFLQLLDAGGALIAQRDSEPGGGLALTTTWTPGEVVIDNHALIVPASAQPGSYRLIMGLYDLNDPAARLAYTTGLVGTGEGDALMLAVVVVE
jgi:hypothetical protein